MFIKLGLGALTPRQINEGDFRELPPTVDTTGTPGVRLSNSQLIKDRLRLLGGSQQEVFSVGTRFLRKYDVIIIFLN
jgi:hypothetical protein